MFDYPLIRIIVLKCDHLGVNSATSITMTVFARRQTPQSFSLFDNLINNYESYLDQEINVKPILNEKLQRHRRNDRS
jgi:hypothetical protein